MEGRQNCVCRMASRLYDETKIYLLENMRALRYLEQLVLINQMSTHSLKNWPAYTKNITFRLTWFLNTDETGCSTVSAPPKIIAEKGSKQIGQVTSAERGTLVTTLFFFINATGGSIPPVFIFPRVNYKDHMLNNGPSGALGLAHVSGWMTENNFVKAMQHFAKHTKPTEQNPALLILDNHASHVNLHVIEFARQNFIKILTFPPHCSHRLQPTC